MADEVERVSGTWTGDGQTHEIKREWRGHTFTDDEIARLFGGATIEVMCMSKQGKEYAQMARISDKCSFTNTDGEEVVYFGVESLGFPTKVPESWAGYEFSPDEIAALEAGKIIDVEGVISKKSGKPYNTRLVFGEAEDGRKKIVPEFADAFDQAVQNAGL